MNNAHANTVRVPFSPYRTLIKAAFRAMANHASLSRDMRQLNAMSDADLKDIGLHRYQVESAVRHGMPEGFRVRG